MKKIIFSLTLIVLFFSCKVIPTNISKEQQKSIKSDINLVVNNWHKAATEANFDNYFDLMDNVSVFIGTDASENWSKEQFTAFSKPYFDKGKAWDFKTIERNIYTNKTGDFVWFDELLNTWMGTCRGSGVLEKKDNVWKIKHYVLSVSVPNDDINKVIKIIKKDN
jgi:hypothetical protein